MKIFKKSKNGSRNTKILIALLLILTIAISFRFVSQTSTINATKPASATDLLPDFSNVGILRTNYTSSNNNCTTTTPLFSIGLHVACTETFVTDRAGLPKNIVISKFSFSSTSDASVYLQNVSSNLNSTPWGPYLNVTAEYVNGKVVYATILYKDVKVRGDTFMAFGAYLLVGNNVVGVSALSATNTSYSFTKTAVINILNKIGSNV